ncbi:MAG: AAA family ATPase [Bacteroidia bacterium]
MKLFLHNIRGFSECAIELSKVNFLVGENSSGKSSFLSILSLLSDPRFSLSGEFKNDFVNFGLFSDIITKSSTDKKAFYIGAGKSTHSDFQQTAFGFDILLVKFIEHEGYPDVESIVIKTDRGIIQLGINKANWSVAIFQLKKNHISDDEIFADFIHNGRLTGPYGEMTEITTTNRLENVLFFPSSFSRISQIIIFLNQLLENRMTPITFKKKLRSFLKGNSWDAFYFSSAFLSKTTWIAPIRSKPENIYTPTDKKYSPEGEHIPTILRDLFEEKGSMASKNIIQLLESFGKASGLFDKIHVEKYKKNQKNSPFDIILSLHGNKLKISNVGYGVSQILPVLTEIIRSKKATSFLIQQPEVHLHPRSQAHFGEFIFNQFLLEDKSFLIETHSDFIIDRFRKKIGENKKRKSIHQSTSILFFENKNGVNKIHKIPIEPDGSYSDAQPDSFRDFFLKEQLDLLEL